MRRQCPDCMGMSDAAAAAAAAGLGTVVNACACVSDVSLGLELCLCGAVRRGLGVTNSSVQGGDASNAALGSLLSSSQGAQPHLAGGPFLPASDASAGMMSGLPVGVDLGAAGGAVGQPAPPSLVQVDPGVIVGIVNMHPDHAAVGTVQGVHVEGVRPAGGGGKKSRLSQARAAWQHMGSLAPEGLGAGGMGVGGLGGMGVGGMMTPGLLGANGDGSECEHKRPLRECTECSGEECSGARGVRLGFRLPPRSCCPLQTRMCARRACVQGAPCL